MKRKKKKLLNAEFNKAVGQSTLVRIDWRDWQKEQPKNGAEIYVVAKAAGGDCHVESGVYLDVTLPANGPFSEHRYRSVRFHSLGMCEIFLGTKQEKCLIAWGYPKAIVRLGKECPICKRIDCIC